MKAKRGVNLGGWLVLEKWITPSLFLGTRARDEHTLVAELGLEAARERISNHRDTFITEETIKTLHSLGVDALRLPVGYWLFDDTDGFIGGAEECVDKVFNWARLYDMGVMLDIHAVPGSQNGHDHSGWIRPISWGSRRNSKRSLRFLKRLCRRFGREERLIGVELMNEPSSTIPLKKVLSYYKKGGRVVERYCHDKVDVVMSDSYAANKLYKLLGGLGIKRPVMDMHLYQLFAPSDQNLSINAHEEKARSWVEDIKRYQEELPVVIGEWTMAINGNFSHTDYARYAIAEINAFEATGSDWFYWTARTEDGGSWSLVDQASLILGKKF